MFAAERCSRITCLPYCRHFCRSNKAYAGKVKTADSSLAVSYKADIVS